MDFLSGMDTGSFLTCVQTITTQLDSLQADISAQAAFAMDHFATYYVRNAKKDTEVMAALSTHLASQPALFEMLMKVVFELVVFGDIGNQWSLARPLLSLTLASETVRPGVSVATGGWRSLQVRRSLQRVTIISPRFLDVGAWRSHSYLLVVLLTIMMLQAFTDMKNEVVALQADCDKERCVRRLAHAALPAMSSPSCRARHLC